MEVEDKKEEEGGGRSEEEEEAEATVAEATGIGKGGGTGIGWGTTGFVAFAAGIVGGGGGGGGGDPTWTAEVVAVAASYSCTSETVGTRPCGFRFFFFYTGMGWLGGKGLQEWW